MSEGERNRCVQGSEKCPKRAKICFSVFTEKIALRTMLRSVRRCVSSPCNVCSDDPYLPTLDRQMPTPAPMSVLLLLLLLAQLELFQTAAGRLDPEASAASIRRFLPLQPRRFLFDRLVHMRLSQWAPTPRDLLHYKQQMPYLHTVMVSPTLGPNFITYFYFACYSHYGFLGFAELEIEVCMRPCPRM